MTKLFTLAIAIIIFSTAYSNSRFEFSNISYKKALKESKSNSKEIMIFFNIPDNKYCQEIENKAFDNPEVLDLFQDKFINIKIDPNTKEGAKLVDKFNLRAFPSIVFINSKEEIIHKVVGVNKNTNLLLLAQKVISHQGTLKYYRDQYNKDSEVFTRNPALFLAYIDVLYNAGEEYIDEVEKYFSILNSSQMKEPANIDAIIKYSDNIYSPEFDFLARNYTNLKPLKYKEKDVILKLENVISNQVISSLTKDSDLEPVDTINAILDYFGISEREFIESKVMLDYYSIIKQNETKYMEALRRYMPLHIGFLSSEQITDYCSQVLKSNDFEIINDAIMWSNQGIDKAPNLDLFYIRIQLMIKAGITGEAKDEISRMRDLLGDNITEEWLRKLDDLKINDVREEPHKLKIVK